MIRLLDVCWHAIKGMLRAALWDWRYTIMTVAGGGACVMFGISVAAPVEALVVLAALGGGWGMLVAHDMDREDPVTPEYVSPEEPVDECGHDDPAVPIEADVTGDGEAEVIGWLCTHDGCYAKVSHRAAVIRNLGPMPSLVGYDPRNVNVLRQALHEQGERCKALLDTADVERDGETFVFQQDVYENIRAEVACAEQIRAMLNDAEELAERRRALRIKCPGFVEEGGSAPGSVVRRYAVPGECLCGACEEPEPGGETHEVYSHHSDVPVRAFRTPPPNPGVTSKRAPRPTDDVFGLVPWGGKGEHRAALEALREHTESAE